MMPESKVKDLLSRAVTQAEIALNTGNYPFGAVLTDFDGEILAEGYNENFSTKDITAHAEMQCLRKIDINKLLDRNEDFVMFCSGEPCCGCSFFIARTKVKTLYWALTDPQKESLGDLKQDETYNRGFFSHLAVVEEPFPEVRQQSANLLKQYYTKINKPEKLALYK
jgi:tRNA(adenine34) deaminase